MSNDKKWKARNATAIKIQMAARKVSQADIAKSAAVSEGLISSVIKGDKRSEKAEAAIAAAIDEVPEALFPDYPKGEVAE